MKYIPAIAGSLLVICILVMIFSITGVALPGSTASTSYAPIGGLYAIIFPVLIIAAIAWIAFRSKYP